MTRSDIARELERVWRETRADPPRLQVRLALLKMIDRVTSRNTDAEEIDLAERRLLLSEQCRNNLAETIGKLQAEVSRLTQARDAYRRAARQIYNGVVGQLNAGRYRADLVEDGVRLFDEAEAISGEGCPDDRAEIQSHKGKWEAAEAETLRLTQALERHEKCWSAIGETLLTGGMDDPAFLTGAVQALYAMSLDTESKVEQLTQALQDAEREIPLHRAAQLKGIVREEPTREWLLKRCDWYQSEATRQSEGLARLIAQGRALRPHWTTSEDGFHTVDPVPAGEEQWGRWLKKSEVYTLLDKLTALVSPEVPTS